MKFDYYLLHPAEPVLITSSRKYFFFGTFHVQFEKVDL